MYFGSNFINPSYSIANIELSRESSMRDLGIIYNKKFDFTDHIHHVVSISNKKLGIFKYTARSFKNINTILKFYKSTVLSTLTFGSVI